LFGREPASAKKGNLLRENDEVYMAMRVNLNVSRAFLDRPEVLQRLPWGLQYGYGVDWGKKWES
jgi:hypothetical protein